LSSTIDDYAAFLQMLLNNGTANGRRLLKPETVALITQNHIGELNQDDNKFGLGFSITTAREPPSSLACRKGPMNGAVFSGTTYWG
jgi:CubicO group peptidase (beta-lactamase class C family)